MQRMSDNVLRGLPDRAIELILRASNTSGQGEAPLLELSKGLHALPELENSGYSEFRYHGYEIFTGLTLGLKGEVPALEFLRTFELTCAPEYLTRFDVGDGWSVLVVRYRACTVGRLTPVEDVRGPFSNAAKVRFLDDLQALSERGLYHAYAHRAYEAWRVASDSGMIVLNGWGQGLQRCSPAEAADSRKQIERLLERKS